MQSKEQKNGRGLGTRLLHCGKVGGGIDPATEVKQCCRQYYKVMFLRRVGLGTRVCVQKILWQSVPIHIHECNLPPEKTCKVKFQVLHTCVELICSPCRI